MSTRFISRLAILVIVAMSMSAPAKPVVAVSVPHTTVATRIYYPEVRLRKMHLVRPDLILYPLFFDIYC
jgi:hypothetical protein